MLARKLLDAVGIFMMTNYAAVNGQCWKPCPPSWSLWQDKCYKMHDAEATWEEGKEICVGLGGVMVVPQSKEEIQNILNMFSCNSFRIGCNDIQTEDTWVCLDGDGTIDVLDNRWAWGHPRNDSPYQNCAIGYASGWYAEGCRGRRTLICQHPASPALLLL